MDHVVNDFIAAIIERPLELWKLNLHTKTKARCSQAQIKDPLLYCSLRTRAKWRAKPHSQSLWQPSAARKSACAEMHILVTGKAAGEGSCCVWTYPEFDDFLDGAGSLSLGLFGIRADYR